VVVTVAGPSGAATAATLADRLRAFETPDEVVRSRLAIASQVAADLGRTESLVAVLVVGSTALRRCSVRADLDLVIIAPSRPSERFESRFIDGVQVEIERQSVHEALIATTGSGWVWELRTAARLGCNVPAFDSDGCATDLTRRAAAMTPSPDRFEASLRDTYVLLIQLGNDDGDPARRMDALRGCLDNLALLALLERPRRYQKAKWVLADLLYAGEGALVDATLAAYGIVSDDAASAQDAAAGVQELIERTYATAALPPHEAILTMGYAPELAHASYVSRCLEDAGDLAASGRFVEAQYVAKFAARLAAGVAAGSGRAGPGGDPGEPCGIVDAFAAGGRRNDLAGRYLALFQDGTELVPALREAAVIAADARLAAMRSRADGSHAFQTA
jgi:hypothetical protein